PGEVHALDLAPVRLHVALRIAVDAPEHPGPRPLEDQIPGLDRLAVLVDHIRLDPGEREGGRARLAYRGPGQRRDEDMARPWLPPGVHDGTAPATDDLPVPHPRLGVDGLPNRSEQAQRREIAARGVLLAPPDEGPDGRGRRVEDGYAVPLHDAPEAV